tara:strand:+ start:2325 stop:2660 length:336 start_codon:yes stop_codon:yes gene_type:complete
MTQIKMDDDNDGTNTIEKYRKSVHVNSPPSKDILACRGSQSRRKSINSKGKSYYVKETPAQSKESLLQMVAGEERRSRARWEKLTHLAEKNKNIIRKRVLGLDYGEAIYVK